MPADAAHALPQIQSHTVVVQLLVNEVRHFGIQGGHHLRLFFNETDFQSGHAKVLGHLQADKAPSDNGGAFRRFFPDIPFDVVRILHIPQSENPFALDPRPFRDYGQGSGRKNQLVVAFLVNVAVYAFPHPDKFLFRNDFHRFRKGAYVHAEALGKAGNALDEQFLPLGDGFTDIIGQSAVGVGNIRPFFYQNDLGLLVHPTQPRRHACSARHTANDNDFTTHRMHV